MDRPALFAADDPKSDRLLGGIEQLRRTIEAGLPAEKLRKEIEALGGIDKIRQAADALSDYDRIHRPLSPRLKKGAW
ncbi:hypothetical protein [Massilia glaciei]|uniref:hypothetical protein n=1 Tax=Massilia glaciei TaxID=1524097 RepID=UPI0011B1F0E7|nr:hypothetical protein [Massilia glaciei]